MADLGNFKVKIEVDDAYTEALVRFRRHIGGLSIATELAAQVTGADIEGHLEQFATPTKGREAADLRWIAEHRGDWERMVVDGIAWLIAADEHTASIKTNPDAQEA